PVSRLPVYYTGFVHDRLAESVQRARMPQGTFVVSAGDEPFGETLVRMAIGAHAMLAPRSWPPLTVVAGARLPESGWRRLQALCQPHPHVQLRRSVLHLAPELRRAAGSISDCG